MRSIHVHKEIDKSANIEQLQVKRLWMDETPNKHAYQCMPLSLANSLGWGISFPEDISFIWNGICDTTADHVKVISGNKYCFTSRGNATISFNTYLTVVTEESVTTLVMPVPNEFNENAQCFTNLISTSFFKSSIPIAWRITKPNVEIIIPAGTPVATIVPISLGALQEFEVKIQNKPYPINKEQVKEDFEFYKKVSKLGKFTNLYRKAENSRGESVGSHESRTIKLTTKSE
jgi:hypothetical protein